MILIAFRAGAGTKGELKPIWEPFYVGADPTLHKAGMCRLEQNVPMRFAIGKRFVPRQPAQIRDSKTCTDVP